MGVRARNGLPGGVEKVGSIHSLFRAMIGILLQTEGHFGLFRLYLLKNFSIKNLEIDINSHLSIANFIPQPIISLELVFTIRIQPSGELIGCGINFAIDI